MQNIQDVISQLNIIQQRSAAAKNCTGYFAVLYKRMTMAVAEGIANDAFEDGKRMQRMDMIFAQRYFDAYEAYNSGKPCSASWRSVFDACKNPKLVVLQHLLLGVNAHINLDLAIAAASVAPGSSIDALQKDFYRINDVISSLVDDVQKSLSQVWWPMRFIRKIVNGRDTAVLNFSIDKARAASWANAVLLANMNEGQRNVYIQQMDAATSILGNGIQSPGWMMSNILRLVRMSEYDDIARTIRLIDETVVK